MHLKKIELCGFKSFALKTEVKFEKGVTCIVGPNGCGKSNISDAIRWVLGERSAKLLRGAKMEDVIFNGTDFRKPVNLAEVSLTIDNSDQSLPVPYAEVVITRRLHRSGESEYLLNRTPCRLKDIQDLILDTGIGSNSYSMIEQGRIDYILNAQAEERRFLIEEAAGISKFKVKKEEAIRKLERTEQNLLRINDIVVEVERNIKYAERQAKRAEKFKERYEHLKTLEVKKAFWESEAIVRKETAIADQRQNLEQDLQIVEDQNLALSEALKNMEARLNALETEFFRLEADRAQSKERLVSIENHELFSREKIETLRQSYERASAELHSIQDRLSLFREDVDKREHELAVFVNEKLEFEKIKNEKEVSLSSITEQVQASEANIKQLQSELFEAARATSDIKNVLTQFNMEVHTLERTLENLKGSERKLTESLADYQDRQKLVTNDQTLFGSKLSDAQSELINIKARRESQETEISKILSQIQKLDSDKTRLESELEVLKKLRMEQSSDLDTFLNEGDKKQERALLQRLSEVLTVADGYEMAVEAVVRDSVHAIVSQSIDDAQVVVKKLKGEKIAQASILLAQTPLKNSEVTDQERIILAHPFVRARLQDCLQATESVRNLIQFLTGNVYVISDSALQNLDTIIPFADSASFVTTSGVYIENSHIISFRSGNVAQLTANPWVQQKEIHTKSKRYTDITHELSCLTELLEKERKQLNKILFIEEQLRGQVTEFKESSERVVGIVAGLQEQMERLQEELDLVTAERGQIALEIVQYQQRISESNQKLDELNRKESGLRQFIQDSQTRQEALENSRNDLERELARIRSRFEVLAEREADAKENLSLLKRQITDFTTRSEILTEDRLKADTETQKLTGEIEALAEEKVQVELLVAKWTQAVDQTRQERSNLFASREKLLGEQQSVIAQVDKLKEELHHLSLQSVECTHQKNNIIQELMTRYKIDLAQLHANEYPVTDEEIPLLTEEIVQLREKLESAGPVNMLAIEEYDELKSRFDFLSTQKKDLEESRDSLLEAIRKINRTTKKLFDETLTKVREGFQSYFKTLFGGGAADLVLIDETNPLDSGLDIIARPPGKKPQHISLLSGGEKALTALALLFSLFSVKPSPFAVLDEVDAPLDEANTDRFLSVVQPFLQTTQFIIVTHSRKTIAMGDSLYGVTMEEPGVSKLVSVRLSSDKGIEHDDEKVAAEFNDALN